MSEQGEIWYDRRTLRDWVERAIDGRIALADFQRSLVWTGDRSVEYIEALLAGRPVGLYLVLKIAEEPQLDARPFSVLEDLSRSRAGTAVPGVQQRVASLLHAPHAMGPNGSRAEELVLDGQQRMTSLLLALHGKGERRFFLKMANLKEFSDPEKNLSVERIELSRIGTNTEKARRDASRAYDEDLVPMDILHEAPDGREISPLATWCCEVWKNKEADKSRRLENTIRGFFDKRLFSRDLWCCFLPSSTNREEATNIFVNTNKSSVRVSAFDISVATARGKKRGEDLRTSIRDAYHSPGNEVLRHYFKEDPEDWIPEIGEWMLKVACLHSGKPPQQGHYDKAALEYLLPEEGGVSALEETFADLSWALGFAARRGGVTKRTLPSWPPVHVLAALRRTHEKISDSVKRDSANKLLDSYYWRSLFSDRYDVDANRRLFADFRSLQTDLERIRGGETPGEFAAFRNEDHPLHDMSDLLRNTSWIGVVSRMGRAVASVSVCSRPRRTAVDWVTGELLSIERLRELERNGNLERHHVFPQYLLKDVETAERVNSGLNGVLLDGRTNRKLSKDDPKKYVDRMIAEKNSTIDERQMRDRIESHLVPYDEMTASGELKKRYDEFLEKRAEMLIEEISKLARFP